MTYYLAINPEKQNKLKEEIDKYLKGNDPDLDVFKQMDYLDACVNETLRLIPPVPRIERKATSDCKLGNLFIPKDTYISISTYAVHHDPNNFEDPDQFKPERFLPENKHQIKPGTFLAFADGPRNCIGMRFALVELKYCIVKVLQKYKFVVCPETKVFSEKHKFYNSLCFYLQNYFFKILES